MIKGGQLASEEICREANAIQKLRREAYVSGYLTALDETGIDAKDYDYRKGAEDEASELYPDLTEGTNERLHQ